MKYDPRTGLVEGTPKELAQFTDQLQMVYRGKTSGAQKVGKTTKSKTKMLYRKPCLVDGCGEKPRGKAGMSQHLRQYHKLERSAQLELIDGTKHTPTGNGKHTGTVVAP